MITFSSNNAEFLSCTGNNMKTYREDIFEKRQQGYDWAWNDILSFPWVNVKKKIKNKSSSTLQSTMKGWSDHWDTGNLYEGIESNWRSVQYRSSIMLNFPFIGLQ